jgi:hypothetical protein
MILLPNDDDGGAKDIHEAIGKLIKHNLNSMILECSLLSFLVLQVHPGNGVANTFRALRKLMPALEQQVAVHLVRDAGSGLATLAVYEH